MARPKTKVTRYSFSLTQQQDEALRALMRADLTDNVGDYVGRMIAKLAPRGQSACRLCGYCKTCKQIILPDEIDPCDIPY